MQHTDDGSERGVRWRGIRWRGAALIVLVVLALAVAWLDPVDRDALLHWGQRLAADPRAIAALVLLQAALFTFGLPGSTIFWAIAPFHSAPVATALLVTGSVVGAAGAYALARFLGADVQARLRASRTVRILATRSDFLTQCALRVLPGFPHSAVNLGGGLLRLSLSVFLAAAIVGLAGKWGVYSWAVYRLVEAGDESLRLGWLDLLPLLVLAVFLGGGSWLARRLSRRD